MYLKLNKSCRKYSVNHTVESKLVVFVLFCGRISAIFFLKLQKCLNLGMAFTKLVYDDHGLSYEPLKKKLELGFVGKLRKSMVFLKKIMKKHFSKKAKVLLR